MQAQVNLNCRHQIDDFLAHLELERGLSVHTVAAYEHDLTCAARFWEERCAVADLRSIQASHAAEWIAQLGEDDYTPSSLARKLSALRMLARFLVSSGIREDDFTATLEGPRLIRPLPGTLSPEEINRLLEAPSPHTPQGIRDRALFELMYSAGLRVSELCGISLTSVDEQEGFLRVMGKGSKERMIPVGRRAIQAIEHYLSAARPLLVKPKTGSALFISQQGKPLSRKTIWLFIKNYALKAGITTPVKPHLLRHCFATHLLAGGADLRVIQEMLGHADISTTQIYTAVQTKKLEEEHARFHPRSSMKI